MLQYRGAPGKGAEDEDDPVGVVLHALADRHRRAMVDRLCRGPASVSELARPLPMSLPAVAQHLRVLEASGLVRSEKRGRVRTCRIDLTALQPVERWMRDRRSTWEHHLDSLGAFLAEEATDDKENEQ